MDQTVTTLTEDRTQLHVSEPNNKDIYFKSVNKKQSQGRKNTQKIKHGKYLGKILSSQFFKPGKLLAITKLANMNLAGQISTKGQAS